MKIRSIVMALGLIIYNAAYAQKIGICKVIDHEAIDSVVKGIESVVSKDNQIEIISCQGNSALASQIGAKFVNNDFDVIVSVGTPPSQAIAKYAKEGKTKLVFSSVTNPSKLIGNNSLNITGVSNFVDLKPQIKIILEIQPKLKNLGIIYNIGEENSIYIIEMLRKICKELSINLVEQGIQKISDIPQAIENISQNSDAIFISNDNFALSCIPFIVKKCNEKKIPVYVSDTDQVEKGCLLSLGPNQFEIGIQTGKIVNKILNGKDINSIEIEYPNKTELYINLDTAKKLNINIPENLLKQANTIIQNGEKND